MSLHRARSYYLLLPPKFNNGAAVAGDKNNYANKSPAGGAHYTSAYNHAHHRTIEPRRRSLF